METVAEQHSNTRVALSVSREVVVAQQPKQAQLAQEPGKCRY
jgi:hypothetical protein